MSNEDLYAIVHADIGAMERAFLNCLLAFGVRRSESLGLMKSDFNFSNNTVYFQRSITFNKNDPVINPNSSYVKMWDRITKALNQYLLTKSERKLKQNQNRRITALTFRHDFATQLYYSNISRKKAVEMMGHAGPQMIDTIYAALDAEKEHAEEKIDSLHKNRMAR